MAHLALSASRPIGIGLALAAALVVAGCDLTAKPRIDAVVVLDLDTLRADRLSAYGNPRATTPHLDALAAGGTRFEWAFAQAPYTLPSQVSIFTSLYPQTHGVVRETDRMASAAWTFAESFRAAGWRTGAFVDGGYVSGHYGFDQGFEDFVDLQRAGLASGEARIADWLRAHAGERFLLLVHTYDTHTPYAPPEPFRTRFAALAPPPTPGFEPTAEALEAIRASQWIPPLTRLEPHDLEYSRALYDGEIAFVDAWVGRLFAQLEELGLADRTLVAVVSDHGEEFQEHGSLLHEKLYATVTRVPMIVRAPGGPAGQVIPETVETVDLMPTLLELAGIAPPPALEGRSLAATVLGRGAPPPRIGLQHSPFWGEQRGLVDGEHHLVLTLNWARAELFRYREDPLEQLDLAASDPATVERLVRAMRERAAGLGDGGAVRQHAELPSEIEASLRALGYLR